MAESYIYKGPDTSFTKSELEAKINNNLVFDTGIYVGTFDDEPKKGDIKSSNDIIRSDDTIKIQYNGTTLDNSGLFYVDQQSKKLMCRPNSSNIKPGKYTIVVNDVAYDDVFIQVTSPLRPVFLRYVELEPVFLIPAALPTFMIKISD